MCRYLGQCVLYPAEPSAQGRQEGRGAGGPGTGAGGAGYVVTVVTVTTVTITIFNRILFCQNSLC